MIEKTLRLWIVEIINNHHSLLAIALRQRAKFEHWLKFELAHRVIQGGASNVLVEESISSSDNQYKCDLAFTLDQIRYYVELKTANTNWRIPGVLNLTRPITRNIAGIIGDANKLRNSVRNGIVAFILFPIRPRDRRWLQYLDRISNELDIELRENDHSSRIQVPIGNGNIADLVVVSFQVKTIQQVRQPWI